MVFTQIEQFLKYLSQFNTGDMLTNLWVLTNARLIERCNVLYTFSSFSKVTGSNRTKAARPCDVFRSNTTEYCDVELVIKYSYRSLIHLTSSEFKSTIQQRLQDLLFELSNLILEDASCGIL